MAETNPLRRATVVRAGDLRAFDPHAETTPEAVFETVIDAVGSAATRRSAVATARPGGTMVHVGLQDNDGGLDTRRLALQEITFIGTYTYTPADLRVTLHKLHTGAFGDLGWLEQRALSDGAAAFEDLLHGRSPAPKIVLRPEPQESDNRRRPGA